MNRFLYVLAATTLFCGLCIVPVFAGPFDFSMAEMQMVEPTYETLVQSHVDVTFDTVGNVHGVYSDGRDTASHPFGMTFTANGFLLPVSYPAYDYFGIEGEPQQLPFIVPSTYNPDRSYCMTVNTNGSFWQNQMGFLDTSVLPAEPIPLPLTSFSMNTSYTEYYDVVGGMNYLFYVYAEALNLTFNRYDESGSIWSGEITPLVPLPNDNYSAPTLAMDDAGYIYVAYAVVNPTAGWSYIRARRSFVPFDVNAWGDEKEVIAFPGAVSFEPHIAATGIPGADLIVAVTFLDSDPAFNTVVMTAEEDGDWSTTTPPSFPGMYNVSSALGSTVDVLGPDIAFDAANYLHIVWADDRDMVNRKLYGNVSDNSGISIDPADETQIAGIEEVREPPRIAFGDQVGDMAIAFIRWDGGLFNPYMLVKTTDFFDNCDNDPSTTNFWDSYDGVISSFNQAYGYPRSYWLTNVKGTLLKDYGAVEQWGSISLQFYDDMSTIEDFYVAVDNANAKGVIRMLGVRNDTTQTNYSYSFDGISWTDMGAARSLGWHEIQFIVNEDGLIMKINEDTSKEFMMVSDPAYTSFTSLEMDATGGGYFVDDIYVETYPLGEPEPRPIPSSSPWILILAMCVIGVEILRRSLSA